MADALWRNVHGVLSQFQSFQSSSAANLRNMDTLHTTLEANPDQEPLIRPKLTRLHHAVLESTSAEERMLKEALTALHPLLASVNESQPAFKKARLDDSASISSISPTVPIPSAAVTTTAATEASPTSETTTIPTATHLPSTTHQLSRSQSYQPNSQVSAKSALSSVPTVTSSFSADNSRASTPSITRSAMNTSATSSSSTTNAALASSRGKVRKDVPSNKPNPSPFANVILPLRAGRPVAFRHDSDPGADETGWILCRVVECIGGDKNRYRVQDIQDAEGKEGEPGMIMTATLDALIPMPDPRDKSTYVEQDFPSGADVLALFPETTTFYRGNVVGTPTIRGRGKMYKVVFEDDNGIQRPVEAEHITKYPQ